MRIARMMLMGVLFAGMGMTGCKNSMKQEKAVLEQENASLKSQLADRNKAIDDCNSDLKACQAQLASAGGAAAPAGGGGGAGANPFGGIDGVTGKSGPGEVTASVESDLLFDSGKTTLKANAKKSLDAVAGVLKSKFAGNTIRIAGHTDSDPIKKSGFKSNYHLGFERAYAVREYLSSKGVSAKQMYLASYGPDAPMGAKNKDRRVEIVVITH